MNDIIRRELTERELHRLEYGVGQDYVLGSIYRKLEEIRDEAEEAMKELLSVNLAAPRTPDEPWPPLTRKEWADAVLTLNRERREREQSAS